MRMFERLTWRALIVPAALLLTAGLSAQTLKHRPPPTPAPPVSPNPPSLHQASPAPWQPVLPQGTNLQVESIRPYPMKVNEVIEGRLLHPIYVQGKLAVPQNTLLRGTVVALQPDSKTRLHARLEGDFTPFHTAQVQFNEFVFPGSEIAFPAITATSGAPVIHLASPGVSSRHSFVSRYWAQAKNQLSGFVTFFSAPGFGGRALQALYRQLPYHPERIAAHTMWSFDLAAPLALPAQPASAGLPAPDPLVAKSQPETWSVNALLTTGLSSATAKPGDPVEALVVQPVFDRDRQLVVPQGSVLMGKVTLARAARSLDRNGKLRFSFQQVRFPQGNNKPVEGALAGATTASRVGLTLDAEGTVSPRNQSSAIAPILLTMLAGRALDGDGSFTAQSSVASNGFGFVGRIVGIAAGNRSLAAGIGYYAAGLSTYENFLRPGRNVIFPKDTRIEIETTPLRAPVLKPALQ
jgi:hypothetical protein